MTKDIAGKLRKYAQLVVKRSLIETQSELSSTAVSPRDTGRFRSNWFASSTSPSGATTEATDNPQTDAQGLELDYNKTYYLTNNLPYAQGLCYGGKAVSQPKNWYPTFINGRIPKIIEQASAQAEKEAGL